MTLHMIQLAPDLARLTRWAAGQKLIPARGDADIGYALHASLANAFGALAPKPFALDTRGQVKLLGYTPYDGAALRDHAAAVADPETHRLLGIEKLADKAMPENFRAGQRFAFALRARPTLRTDRDGNRDLTVEKDVFLLAPDNADRGEVYARWVASHFQAGGAIAVRIALDQFVRSKVQRRGVDRRFSQPEGPDAHFSGELEVTDPGPFAKMLARGVGRHRAFGFGMLLLRPA